MPYIFVTFFISFLLCFKIFGATLYTKGLNNKLLKEPEHKSDLIVVLKRGEEVTIITKNKFWNKVKSKKGEGWLPSMLLSKTPPGEKVSLLQKKVDISKNARKRASQFTSTAAARGLRENSSDIFKNLDGYDFLTLEKIEKRYLPNTIGLTYIFRGLKDNK